MILQQLRRRTPLGWIQLRHNKTRLLVSIGGIAFADILMFMQLGILNGLYDSNTAPHRQLQTDIVLVSTQARQLTNLLSFPRRRLYQAMDVPGVASAQALYINFIDWKHPETRQKTAMLVVGVNPDTKAFDLPAVNQSLDKIKLPDTVLFDRAARGNYQWVIDQVEQKRTVTTEIERRTITIAGLFELGASFTTDGILLTSDQSFLRLFPSRQAGQVSLGLVQVQPGSDPEAVVEDLNAYLPQDVKAMTKQGFVDFEKAYIDQNQPIAFVFGLATTIGFIVGIVIVYQILSTDVNDHLAEYATFKAMGYRDRYLLGAIFEEALILAAIGFIPGVGVSLGLYSLLRQVGALPIYMLLLRLVLVFTLTVVMCSLSGIVATRQLRSADPADIF
ncbi:FtsX-like permease family protein [Gloeocapsopsis crepidinum LEGE 06123]|uniref:FtsX-like permease family protein n=1 Tax=Gloeocapsopsis crepidinum LEGE 06123 TaxID=588587 RepID=A0ABR9UQN1_9CHRO|nr:ABC transporter permease DevC [Gloeocapsopsis crepidinum]MBE9190363.1 FtsX-like permease family protein [Gloeocapsopsis crepidinum LEGE 06123]